MLTEAYIRDRQQRIQRVMLVTFGVAAATVLICIGLIAAFRDEISSLPGSDVSGIPIGRIALMLLAVGVFLVILCLGERRTHRDSIRCPSCSADITRRFESVLATRCCGECDARIVQGGRQRSADVFERYQQLRQRRLIGLWLWTWPVFGVMAMAFYAIDPASMERCLHQLFMPALVGTVLSGWAWIRTRHHRYMPPTLVSGSLLALGCFLFWQA